MFHVHLRSLRTPKKYSKDSLAKSKIKKSDVYITNGINLLNLSKNKFSDCLYIRYKKKKKKKNPFVGVNL